MPQSKEQVKRQMRNIQSNITGLNRVIKFYLSLVMDRQKKLDELNHKLKSYELL
jgi:hypothetical protein